jgi:hypothetical protein
MWGSCHDDVSESNSNALASIVNGGVFSVDSEEMTSVDVKNGDDNIL